MTTRAIPRDKLPHLPESIIFVVPETGTTVVATNDAAYATSSYRSYRIKPLATGKRPLHSNVLTSATWIYTDASPDPNIDVNDEWSVEYEYLKVAFLVEAHKLADERMSRATA